MKRYVRGSFTIEASIIVPLILTIFALTVSTLFYYHDKNVVSAIAHETLVMGCSKEEISEEELETYFRTRLGQKLLLFQGVRITATIEQEEITMVCTAKKKGMSLYVDMTMVKTDPEQYIWNLQRIGGID